MIYREAVRVNPDGSYHKKKILFLLILLFSFIASVKGWMLAESTVVNVSQYI